MSALAALLFAAELAAQPQPPADEVAFRRLVGPGGALGGVTAACCFVYRQRGSSTPVVWRFLDEVAPRLLAQLHRSTEPRRVELRGRARGSVDWAGTVKARAGASQDPTIFVCTESWRLYDLPENRLLAFTLHELHRCHDRVPAECKAWALGEPRRGAGEALGPADHRIRQLMRNAYLRDVEIPAAVGSGHLGAARRARNPLYRRLADFHDWYRSSVTHPDWPTWRTLVHRAGLPLAPGDSLELRRLSAAADVAAE